MHALPVINWELILLKQNPFLDVPPRSPKEAVWAGMKTLKREFEALFIEALTTSSTQLVLNWGAYGSGKTHAAIYFGIPERLPEVDSEKVRSVRILHVRTPKEPPRAIEIFYQDIIERLRFSEIRKMVREVIHEYGEEQALYQIQEVTESETLGRAIWLLGMEETGKGQLHLFEEQRASGEWQRLLEAYFYSKATKTDLKRLGLSRDISSAKDQLQVLSGILRCFIGFAPIEDVKLHTRLILWIDEVEDLIYFTSQQHRLFTQGLRDLIDRLPVYFTLLINFTLAAPEDLEDAQVVLGPAVMSRITHQIFFKRPDEDEAYEYITELLSLYRKDDPRQYGLPETYPFDEEALRLLISYSHRRTPRELNILCSNIVREALLRGVVSAQGKGLITREVVDQIIREQASRSMEQ